MDANDLQPLKHNEINEHFFVEMLALLAIEVDIFGNNNIEKIIYFMEFLYQSDGHHKLCQKKAVNNKFWNVLEEIKTIFPS